MFFFLTLALASTCEHHPKLGDGVIRKLQASVSHIPGISFREAISDRHVRWSLIDDLGRECVDALSAALQEGPLFSHALLDHSMAIKDVDLGLASQPNYRFYHYTNHRGLLEQFQVQTKDRQEAHREAIRSKSYHEAFLASRSQKFGYTYSQGNITHQALFVASDPRSSAHKGRYRIVFDLDPRSRVLMGERGFPVPRMHWQFHDREVGAKIAAEYPELSKVCPIEARLNDLLPIFMEGTGISLMLLFPQDEGYWMVFHGPGAIMGTRVEKK